MRTEYCDDDDHDGGEGVCHCYDVVFSDGFADAVVCLFGMLCGDGG